MNNRTKNHWITNRTGSVMNGVTLAMLPGVIAMAAAYGVGILWNLAWLALLSCAVEVGCATVRYGFAAARQRQFDLSDGTTLLAAVIMSICLPPFVSPTILAVAAVAAIGLAKHAYGGLGQNIFNPAMVGYAVILLSFPLALASWPGATDGLTGATLLSEFRYRGNLTANEFFTGRLANNAQTLAAGLFALGGVWLIYQRVMHWRIPLTVLVTVGVLAGIFHDGGSSASLGSPWFHWTTGGTVAAAFFVATDPVTHPARPQHQVLFAMLIGCLLFLLRTQGNLPDGIAFAVLLANCTTPLFNRLHRQQLALGDAKRA